MRKVTVVRLGVAAALAMMGTAGAVGSGCSTSSAVPDGGTGPIGTADACPATGCVTTGDGSTDGPTGTTGTTGSEDAGDAAPPPPANLVLAHTAPGIPPFRVCFLTATSTAATATVAPFPALPDSVGAAPAYPVTGPYKAVAAGTPGIYPGTIGAFPNLGISLQGEIITPFAILASSIAGDVANGTPAGLGPDAGAEETCTQLIGTHGLGVNEVAPSVVGRLTPNQDYFQLPTIPLDTLKDTKTYLLTVNGCLPGGAFDSTAQTAGYTCGGGDAGPWIGVTPMDTTTAVPDGGIGVQFANSSTALANTPLPFCTDPPACTTYSTGQSPAMYGVSPTLIQWTDEDAGEDAGEAPAPQLAPLTAAGAAEMYTGAALTPVMSATLNPAALNLNTTVTTSFGAIVATDGGSAPDPTTGYPVGSLIAMPFSVIAELSSWSSTTAAAPTGFVAGQTYTFILTGDPAAPALVADGGQNPAWDGRGVHVLAFPNVFTPKSQ